MEPQHGGLRGDAMTKVRGLVADIVVARERVLATVRDVTSEKATVRPAPSEWSVAEVLELLVHAERSGIGLIWRAAEGVRRRQPTWEGEHVNRGLSIEEVVERTWGPNTQAPDVARPRWNGPLEYWKAFFAALQPMVDQLVPVLDGLDLEVVVAPHPISGPLDARQRLEFLRFHMDLHRRQIEDIMRATSRAAPV
jgi:hypothetical protein